MPAGLVSTAIVAKTRAPTRANPAAKLEPVIPTGFVEPFTTAGPQVPARVAMPRQQRIVTTPESVTAVLAPYGQPQRCVRMLGAIAMTTAQRVIAMAPGLVTPKAVPPVPTTSDAAADPA